MLLDPVASDLPEFGSIIARAGALPWRRFGPADRLALARHFGALGPGERPARAPDFAASIVVGLATAAVPPGVLALRIHPTDADAELEFSVVPTMRGCGLGSGLARLGIAIAAGAGCRRAVIVGPRDGAALRRLAARLGFVAVDGDARRLVRDLAADAVHPTRDAA
jgi:GNAT superfamily N-acetyltransferase